MSYKDCITNGIAEGNVTKNQADEQIKLFDEKVEEYLAKGMSQADAEKQAAKDSFDIFKYEAAEKKRRELLTLKAQQSISKHFKTYRNMNGEVDYGNAGISILSPDDYSPYVTVENQVKVIKGQAHKILVDVLDTFKPGFGGYARNKATLTMLVREIIEPGSTTNQAAKEMAEAWKASSEFLRLEFNKYGGRIPSRKDWGLPQIHDTLAIRKTNKEDWITYTMDRLDITKMINEKTKLPFNEKTLRLALSDVYETITNEGFNKVKATQRTFGSNLASRSTDHRFLVFKNAQSWIEYQNRFGNNNAFQVMMDHINKMSRDIALMKVLGANPDATISYMTTLIKKQAQTDVTKQVRLPVAKQQLEEAKALLAKSTDPVEIEKLNRQVSQYAQDISDAEKFNRKSIAQFFGSLEEDRANTKIELIKNLYGYHKGALTNPVDGFVARSLAGLRHILTSAQLGSASVLALTDFNWSRAASAHVGLPQHRTAINSVKLLFDPLNKFEKAKLAIRLGLVAEHWSTVASASARYLGEIEAPQVAKRISDSVLRVSGLSHLTQAGRWSFGMELMGFWAENVGKQFKELPEAMQKTFLRYGINDGSWDLIRQTKLYDAGIDDVNYANKGATFLRPDDIRLRTDLTESLREDLTSKLMELVVNETEFAIPATSARGKVALFGNQRSGTIGGELINSVAMYKNFPITFVYTHLRRGFTQTNLTGKMKYVVPLVISGTLFGALAYELGEITKGRDVTSSEKMQEPSYWLKAMIKGGGLGIFGDFITASQNQYGRNLSGTILGAPAGFFEDVAKLTFGNIINLATGEETTYGRDVSDFLRQYTPGASLWYARLALERLIFDNIQKMIDPKFNDRIIRRINKYKDEQDKEYFWKPGESFPERTPKINIFE